MTADTMNDTAIAVMLQRWQDLLSEGTTAQQHGDLGAANARWADAVDALDRVAREIEARRRFTMRKITLEG